MSRRWMARLRICVVFVSKPVFHPYTKSKSLRVFFRWNRFSMEGRMSSCDRKDSKTVDRLYNYR